MLRTASSTTLIASANSDHTAVLLGGCPGRSIDPSTHHTLPQIPTAESVERQLLDLLAEVDEPATTPPAAENTKVRSHDVFRVAVPTEDRQADPAPLASEPGPLLLFYRSHLTCLPSLITLIHLGVPFRLCRISPEDVASGRFSGVHPWSEPPVLWTPEGIDLSEQMSILTYLNQIDGRAGFLPPERSELSLRFHDLCQLLDGRLKPALEQLAGRTRVSEGGGHPGWHRTQEALADVTMTLRHVAIELGDHDYLLGDQYSVLDSMLYALLRWADRLVSLERERPQLARFVERIESSAATRSALQLMQRIPQIQRPAGFLGEVDLESFTRDPLPFVA